MCGESSWRAAWGAWRPANGSESFGFVGQMTLTHLARSPFRTRDGRGRRVRVRVVEPVSGAQANVQQPRRVPAPRGDCTYPDPAHATTSARADWRRTLLPGSLTSRAGRSRR